MGLRSTGRLTLCLLLCLGVGILESTVTRSEIPGWYAGLVKPAWTPPPLAFPIVWTLLYILMSVSLWRLWDRAAPSAARTTAIVWFAVQLAFNAAWSPVFFGWHAIQIALIVIIALLVAIAMTIITTSRVDRFAAWLLVPYLIWVAYATTVNAGVVVMN